MSETTNNLLPQQDPLPSDTICSSKLRLNSPNPATWTPLGYTAKDLVAKFTSHIQKFDHLSAEQIHKDTQYSAFFDRFFKNGILNYYPEARDPNNPRFSVDFIRGIDELFFDGALTRNLTREQFNIQFAKCSSRRWRKQAERENRKEEPSKSSGLVSTRGVTVFNNPSQLRFYDECDSVAAEIHIFESGASDLEDTPDARARFYVGTILHECLRAFAGLYVCNCCSCLGGYNDINRSEGQGPLFLEMGCRFQKLATKVFGKIDLGLEVSFAEELCLLEGACLQTVNDTIDRNHHIIERLGLDRTKIKCGVVEHFEERTRKRLGTEEEDEEIVDSDVDGEKEDDPYSDEDEWEGQPRNGFLQYYNRYYGDC